MAAGLGYRGNPNWRDMSEYVVHFTKESATGSAYENLLGILASGQLRRGGAFGAARNLGALEPTQSSVCFSEIPLDRLDRLTERRSQYGVGFHQQKLLDVGGARVWYVDAGSEFHGYIRAMLDERIRPGMDTDDLFWALTPFIDFPGEYGDASYRFEWEREWRVPGEMGFVPDEVAFLFIPERLHGAARSFFQEHRYNNTGPAYLCPYLDPSWSDARIQEALKDV